MFFLILYFGARSRKITATYYFFIYTLVGSLLLLFAILILYFEFGTFNVLVWYDISNNIKQFLIWMFLFFSFAIKIPIFPFHIWLPEAHVEAPTVGSVILASILLKIGGYGLLRFLILPFPISSYYYALVPQVLCLFGTFYSSIITIKQIDLKKIIAYSSITHMNFTVLNLFSYSFESFQGAILLFLGHGLISAGLFFLVGFLYSRYHTRTIKYFSGLALTMPLFSFFFLFFMGANCSLPLTVNFIAEFLLLVGFTQTNFLLTFVLVMVNLFNLIFSFWLLNRLLFAEISLIYNSVYYDLVRSEFFVISVLGILVFMLGVFPTYILEFLTFYFKFYNFIN
jgi:proton-translocating NADH-quinone oxidoreductase chain M